MKSCDWSRHLPEGFKSCRTGPGTSGVGPGNARIGPGAPRPGPEAPEQVARSQPAATRMEQEISLSEFPSVDYLQSRGYQAHSQKEVGCDSKPCVHRVTSRSPCHAPAKVAAPLTARFQDLLSDSARAVTARADRNALQCALLKIATYFL